MVDKFKEILKEITESRGDVTLFGIFKMDEITDRWSVILSATWLTLENKDEVFTELARLMKNKLSNEESSEIARIGLFSTDEHLIDLLLNFKTSSRIQDQKINGNIIHDGYILASNRDTEPVIIPLP